MALKTKLTEILGLKIPILQAPMGGGVAGPELATAVSKAGGLGMLPIWPLPLDAAQRAIDAMKGIPFAVNLNVAFNPAAHLDLALSRNVPIVHFFWGDASAHIARAKQAGALVMATVASSVEALAARDAGADVLIAQGSEAGGHVWGRTTLLSLVPMVVDAAGDVPVVAAGGIADGRGLAAALALGASGAMVGTALIVADESGAHADYKKSLLDATDGDTLLGTVFDVGWPDAPCRTLRNSTIRAWEAAGRPASGKRPGEGETVARDPSGREVPRYSVTPPARGAKGEIEAMALYAGEGVGLVTRTEPASAILGRMVEEAGALIRV